MTQPIRKIHWNSFPAGTRQRLVDSLEGRGAPAPLASFPEAGVVGATVGWSIVLVAGLVAALGLAAADFGATYSFRQPIETSLAYAGAGFFFLYAAFAIARAFVRRRAMPWARGRYLFPLELVDARTEHVELLPTAAIENLRVVHHYRNGVYGGTQVELTFPGNRKESLWFHTQEKAQQTLDALRATQDQVADAARRNDAAALRALDVFFEVRGARELDDPAALAAFRAQHEREAGTPLAATLPLFARRTALLALGVSVAVGLPFYFLRNLVSDAAAYSAVETTTASYVVEAYLNGGGSEADEARAVHLPRTKYLEAESARSVSALRAFVGAFPSAPQVPAARASIHRLFGEAQAAFLAQAPNDPRMRAFVLELLAFLEGHDTPEVQVRFAAPTAAALTALDAELDARGRREGGYDIIPIAPHFTPDRTAAFEGGVTSVLAQGFRGVVADDVLGLVHAGRIEKNAPLDPVHPALDVSYAVEPTDALYTRPGDSRGFVGIHVRFDVTMRIPGSASSYAFSVEVEPPQSFTVQSGGAGPASDGQVYTVMAERAFDQLGTRLASAFFGAPVAAGAVNAAALPPGVPPKLR